ncbi:MAG TPA: sialidase family protein [Capsulimonadaceae bacterium]|jgi:sialidase-1
MEKFTISRDDTIYEAWPDIALTPTGRLVCVFSECSHHGNRSYTRIVTTHSDDRGRTWSGKSPVTEPLHKPSPDLPHWNCARVVSLSDSKLYVTVDTIAGGHEGNSDDGEQCVWLFVSSDDGLTWTGPLPTPVEGIVPDRLIEVKHGDSIGRWILAAHKIIDEVWEERAWLSDDCGATWSTPITIARDPELKLCEGSVFELPGGELCCLMRENSFQGLDAFKSVSRDGGLTWGTVTSFALPGCHRPVGGLLQSGRVLVTHRFLQGGAGWLGWWTQNLFAALTTVESCLADSRGGTSTRIMPLDYDRSPVADTGYSGWVQFPDGEIYVVNYIVDDAPKAQIRGYSIWESDFILEQTNGGDTK